MYMCVRGFIEVPVPSQEREWSCICVYQARNVSGHVFVCKGSYRSACNKPGT
jgi:hypothetical protein